MGEDAEGGIMADSHHRSVGEIVGDRDVAGGDAAGSHQRDGVDGFIENGTSD